MNMDRKKLYCYINELCFAIYDLQLYLDTHPDDCDAHAYLCQLLPKKEKAMAEYQSMYGPLAINSSCCKADKWIWATQSWPWKRGYC